MAEWVNRVRGGGERGGGGGRWEKKLVHCHIEMEWTSRMKGQRGRHAFFIQFSTPTTTPSPAFSQCPPSPTDAAQYFSITMKLCCCCCLSYFWIIFRLSLLCACWCSCSHRRGLKYAPISSSHSWFATLPFALNSVTRFPPAHNLQISKRTALFFFFLFFFFSFAHFVSFCFAWLCLALLSFAWLCFALLCFCFALNSPGTNVSSIPKIAGERNQAGRKEGRMEEGRQPETARLRHRPDSFFHVHVSSNAAL